MAITDLATIGTGALLGLGATVLVFAALHDIAARTIPNWNSAGLFLLGLGLRLADGHVLAGLVLSGFVFLATTFCWRRGWMGGGDVKLLTATAIFVPPALVPIMLATVSLAGGGVALVYLCAPPIMRRFPARPVSYLSGGQSIPRRVLRAERWRLGRGGPLPYAPAIALGALFTTMWG